MSDTTIGIVGAGAMGTGIAQCGLAAQLDVVLYDLDPVALKKAQADIFGRLARLVEKGQLSKENLDGAQKRLRLASSLADFASATTVVEAIVERLEPKRALLLELEALVGEETLLATNTSSLSVAAIAAGCARKQRVLGLHFFNPVPLMRLVEVICAPCTSKEAADRGCALAKALGKTAVLVKDGPGFLVNLGGRAYVTEGLHVVQEGVADVQTVDRIMREAMGFRMGPFELMDLTGIDVNFPASQGIYEGFQHDPRVKTTTLHAQMFNAGQFGRKTGQGYYVYPAEKDSTSDTSEPIATADDSCRVALPEGVPALEAFAHEHHLEVSSDAGISLIAPLGEDAAGAAARLGLSPSGLVAIDLTALEQKFVTVMAPLGNDGRSRDKVANYLRGRGLRVAVIKDSPGFVVQRIVAMIANLGCEMAQIGVGTPEDIDLAMRLAQNYPQGPFEFTQKLGPSKILSILGNLQAATGSDRYRPSLWLRRRAQLGRSIYERD